MKHTEAPLGFAHLDCNRQRYQVIGRLCFDRRPVSPVTSVIAQDCAAENLWSPIAGLRPEKHIPGLFSLSPPATTLRYAKGTRAGIYPGRATKGGEQSCCICLDDIDDASPSLSCHVCSMRAHRRCLGSWFDSTAAARKRATPGLPSTVASCPYCREDLDWDALELYATVNEHRRRPLLLCPIDMNIRLGSYRR